MFRRHRPGATHHHHQDDDDDDEEEDVFGALSRRSSSKKAKNTKSQLPLPQLPPKTKEPLVSAEEAAASPNPSSDGGGGGGGGGNDSNKDGPLIASTTSSMKRHHKEGRKAKMDAMLEELLHQQEQQQSAAAVPTADSVHSTKRQRRYQLLQQQQYGHDDSPLDFTAASVRGSHVEPGQEHMTTNIFVGNLAPHITEEELTNLFGHFGQLYSVKIMWPRTAEERARQRLTGFVCFYQRSAAEDAMHACNEADPFNVGRRLMLRWGKNVLRSGQQPPPSTVVRPELGRRNIDSLRDTQHSQPLEVDQSNMSGKPRIQVEVPSDPRRAKFIDQVASFVAKDGSDLEQRLVSEQHVDMAFLTPNASNRAEHIYYKWRVHAYTQGDSEFLWKTDPFVMVGACVWIPPPIADREAAAQREREHREQEERQRERRPIKRPAKRGVAPSQQSSSHNHKQRPLSHNEFQEFDQLTRRELCASREAIARAMAFCFEKGSHSCKEIADLLRELLLQQEGVSVDTRIARLYLLSDVLFNAQQPGVRNAFFYRDAIEEMAPEVFTSLGATGSDGRLTQHKMRKAVSGVLAAWTNWSVYIPSFLDELQARFEGRPIPTPKADGNTNESKTENVNGSSSSSEEQSNKDVDESEPRATAKGDWADVKEETSNCVKTGRGKRRRDDDGLARDSLSHDDDLVKSKGENANIAEQDYDVDGEPLDNKVPYNVNGADLDDADGEPLDDDADGEPLDDADGVPLEDDDDVGYEPL